MRTEVCPVQGFEQVRITFPSEWLIKHNEAFWAAYREAGDKVSHNTGLLYGCIAVCEQIEGLPNGEGQGGPGEWPLQVYNWLLKTVYFDSLEKALNPATLKNS